MSGKPDTFGTLFRKYRLKAEFTTLSEFGAALAEKGLVFEDSIFTRWQNNSRLPHDRKILLTIIKLFVERGAISHVSEINAFLASAKRGYLSDEERELLDIKTPSDIFQVPAEIHNFSGRNEILDDITGSKKIHGSVILLHGPAGVGKTALAIKLGHTLRQKFSDGVLWYKVEKDNLADILFSIARVFGEDISEITNIHVRATVVRALLASKNALIFLDSAELNDDVCLLIPNSDVCTIVLTSQHNTLKSPIEYTAYRIDSFTDTETLLLFQAVLGKQFRHEYKDVILRTAKRVGNLPLALHILARHMMHARLPITKLPGLLDEEGSFFQGLRYEDKNLRVTFEVSYGRLDQVMKAVLVSASIFKGKDFSVQSIGYINGLSTGQTTHALQRLSDLSLVENSTKNRYRLHPAIQEFVREKLDSPRSSRLILIAWIIFIFFSLWWVYLQVFVEKENNAYGVFAFTYCVLALYGVVSGLMTSIKWGGVKTLLGKSVALFSCGLFMQTLGQIAYAYFTNIEQIKVPYPSLGDFGYFGTIPFYIGGAYLLAKSSGVKITMQSYKKKLLALLIPTAMLVFGYLLFLQDYVFEWNSPLKIFLDFVYPLGEAVYISIAIITFIFSRVILDGIMRSKALLILIALFVQFLADYTFLYTVGSYYQGNYVDLIYLTSYFLMTLALLHLKSIMVHVKDVQ